MSTWVVIYTEFDDNEEQTESIVKVEGPFDKETAYKRAIEVGEHAYEVTPP
jgi:hypothetical protein